jgi:hypothetical protein
MTISQKTVQDRLPKGRAGDLANAKDYKERLVKNFDPEQTKRVDVTVSTAAPDTEYAYDVEGETISVQSSGSPSKNSIAQKLADAHNDNPLARATVEARVNNDEVELVGIEDGYDFTFSQSDANLTDSLERSAQEADSTKIGRAIDDQGRELEASNFTPKSVTFTHGGSAGSDLTLRVATGTFQVSGDDASGMVTAINNHPTLGDILTASEPNGGEVKVEVQVPGDFFEVVDSDDLQSLDSMTDGDSFRDILNGISRSTYAEEDGDTYEIPPEAGVISLYEGWIYVETGDNASQGDPVFINMTGGDSAGSIETSRTPGETVRAPGELLEWDDANEVRIKLD